MVRVLKVSLLAWLSIALTGCATLFGGGTNQGVSVTSEPTNAPFTVKAESGMQMTSGKTPQTIRLPRNKEYQIEFTVPGYRPQSVNLTKGMNGWVWVNILFWPGFIVDFVNGAAFTLEPSLVQISMQRGTAATNPGQLFGVVRQFDASGNLIREQRVELQRVELQRVDLQPVH